MNKIPDLTTVANHICDQQGFKFAGKIGEGSYKETFKVINKNTGEALALKVYKPGSSQRSEREIDAMKRCNHTGIAKLHYIGTITISINVYVFVFEEFLAGGTLGSRLQRNGLLSLSEVLELGDYLIDAVAHIQALDLVHRDLKPENIIFREINVPVITDFGIVRDLRKTSLTQSWLERGPGSYLYAAPEQLNNEKHLIDWRTDQFSLGVVLAICIFGEHPFGTDFEIIVDNVSSRRPTTQNFRTNVERSGLTALGIMVNVWPANRYPTPIELQSAWKKQKGK